MFPSFRKSKWLNRWKLLNTFKCPSRSSKRSRWSSMCQSFKKSSRRLKLLKVRECSIFDSLNQLLTRFSISSTHTEIPIIKTVEIPKPYEVVKHIPIVKTVEVEKEVIKKVPVAEIQHITKEITLPKLHIPSIPHIKPSFSHFSHSSEPEVKSYVTSSHSGPQSYDSYGLSSSSSISTGGETVIEAWNSRPQLNTRPTTHYRTNWQKS